MSSDPIRLCVDASTGTGIVASITTFEQATEIPADVKKYMPAQSMAISDFVNTTIPPSMDPETVIPVFKIVATTAKPSWSMEQLQSSQTPPQRWVSDLIIKLRLSWATNTGLASVAHPLIPELRLPLWIGAYWDGLITTGREQARWKSALAWLMSCPETPARICVTDLLARTPWGLTLWPMKTADPDTYAGRLALLLSEDWVDETQLDLVAIVLNACSQRKWWASNCYVAARLQAISKPNKDVFMDDPTLLDVNEQVASRAATSILLPVNLNSNHWIVVHVDLAERTITYGMCSSSYAHYLPSLPVPTHPR